MGYEYGVWLLPEQNVGENIVKTYNIRPHIRHITVACNMTRDNANLLLKRLINESIVPSRAEIIGRMERFPSLYGKDCVYATGWYLHIHNWHLLKSMVDDIGTFSIEPHLSLVYSVKEIGDNLFNHLLQVEPHLSSQREFSLTPAIANITSNNSWEWSLKSVLI